MASQKALVGTVRQAIDRPASEKLEDFLTDICWRLQEMPDRSRMTLGDFANAFRSHFKLGIPLMPQLDKLLRELGVGLESRTEANGLDGSFDFNPLKARWEIYVPSDLGLRESFVTMHEVFELVAWRCYHRIPWWAEWAREEGCTDPHSKADEFAFLTVLPSHKFRNRARKHGYDLWKLSTLCQANTTPCFQALTRFVFFSFPFFHAFLSVGAQTDQVRMIFDENELSTKVLRKSYKNPTDGEAGIDWTRLPPDQYASWDAVTKLSDLPSRHGCFEIKYDDLIYQARNARQTIFATTDRIAGLMLDAPVDVIINPKPDQPSLVYLQVVPAGYAQRLAADY